MNLWIPHPLILESEKVQLVPLEEEHFNELIELGRDEQIWQFMPVDWAGKKDLREILQEAIRARREGSQYPFVAIDKRSGQIFGSTRFLRISREHRNLEIGWTWYAPSYWSTGFNKECKYLLLEYCFEILLTISVYLGTATDNIRSQKAIEGLGAKQEGVIRNRIISKGQNKSFVVYSITEDEWPFVKEKLKQSLGKK